MSRTGELHYQLIKYSNLKTQGIVTEIVKQFHSCKTEKNCYSKGERIRIIITSITWSYSIGDIQTCKGKMTTQMILIPIDRLKELEKKYQQIHLQNSLLMWNLNCYNKTRIYAHVLGNQNIKKKNQWIVPCSTCNNRRGLA